jgi:hypothetical protein
MEPSPIHISWFKRKFTGGPAWTVASKMRFSQRYVHRTRTGYISGELTLLFTPAESFSFHSRAKWPPTSDRSDRYSWLRPARLKPYFESMILDAILDVLLASIPSAQVLVAKVILDEIVWENGHSDAVGFYWAARKIMEKLLKTNNRGSPIYFLPTKPNTYKASGVKREK